MNNYRKHALNEFKAAGWINSDGEYEDKMQEDICNHILKLLDVFSDEGHSGATAPYTINLFSKLALFETVTPLTGGDEEWNEIGFNDGTLYQNKRNYAIFKNDKEAYYFDAVVFVGEHGSFRANSVEYSGGTISSRQYIKEFPFTPKTFYVDVEETGGVDKIKDESQLEDIFSYYKKV